MGSKGFLNFLNKCRGLALAFIFVSAYGQEDFRDIAGQPFFPHHYVDVNGSPYMFEDWVGSTIVLTNGQKLNLKANFNLVTNELLFLDPGGKTMVASAAVIKTIEIESRKFIPANQVFYEVISTEGKATLLRRSRKVIMESKAYNSATVQKNFVTDTGYALVANGNLTEVKTANDIYSILESAPLRDFAKKEKLKSRSADSWVKIVDYYNSI